MEAEPYWYLFSPAGLFGDGLLCICSFLPDGRAFLSECAWHGVCGAGKLSDGTWKYGVSDSGGQYHAVHTCVHSVTGRRVTCAICYFAETNIHKKRAEKYVSCTGGGSGSLGCARLEAAVSFQWLAEPRVARGGRGEGGVDDDVRLLLGARAQLSVEESRI